MSGNRGLIEQKMLKNVMTWIHYKVNILKMTIKNNKCIEYSVHLNVTIFFLYLKTTCST